MNKMIIVLVALALVVILAAVVFGPKNEYPVRVLEEKKLSDTEDRAIEIARKALWEKYPEGKIGNEIYKFYSINKDEPNPDWYRVVFDVELSDDKAVWITVDVKTGEVVKFIRTKA